MRCAELLERARASEKEKAAKNEGGRRKRGCQKTGKRKWCEVVKWMRKQSAVVGVCGGVLATMPCVWYPAAAPYFFYYRQSGGA